MISKCLGVNNDGHLTIGGMDTTVIAEQYGTPLYVMDENLIRENCRSYRESIEKFYGGRGLIAYASKAFSCKEIYRIANDEKIGVDIVSIGELHTAMSVNFPADKMVFHGNNKTVEELMMAINYGVTRIVVDNLTELDMLSNLAKTAGKVMNIMLRIKPGVDAHTHDFIRTGQIDSKFGFALETGEAFEAAKAAIAAESLKLIGVHCHIGSQIFDIEPFEAAADLLIEYMVKVREELGCELVELNIGGGFGIKYTENNDPVPYEKYMEILSGTIAATCDKFSFPMPFIILEPGRSIVASAGITLYTVGGVKEIPNIRTYVSVDGGMTDNPRYALYQSEYTFEVANKADYDKDKLVTIAGKCCESGDLLGKDVQLQDVEVGDILATLATGAYNYAMSSNYNRNLKPAVVMVRDGKSRVVVKRETPDDVIRNDV